MSDRRTPLVTGEFYHIFNRGVARQPIFLSKYDYQQALLALSYYRFTKPPIRLSRFKNLSLVERGKLLKELKTTEKLVEIISYVFMPNHFHFLLKQTADNGISIFLSKLSNSYTKYFNTKHTRPGPLLQGIFKSVHIESDEQLLHLSRYIHLNPAATGVIREDELFSYPWSSLPNFIKGESPLVFLEPVLAHFSSKEDYKKFVLDQVDHARRLEEIKHLTLED